MAGIRPSIVSGLPTNNGLVDIEIMKYRLISLGKIEVSDKDCWVWIGAKNSSGYGCLQISRKALLSHRAIYSYCVNAAVDDVEICHNCPGGDNPLCCNPEHLFEGTHADNMKDAASKGRIVSRDSRGEKNPGAKLTAEKVIAMRKRAVEIPYVRGIFVVLGNEFGVSNVTAMRIVKRQIWKHI